MASYGKVNAFSLQRGVLAQVVTENLRTQDQFTYSGIIPWIDLGTESQYHQQTTSSYGSQASVGLASSADITYSSFIPTKTTVALRNIAVGAQMPIQFMNDPRQISVTLQKKSYELGRFLATTLASTAVATDTTFAGMGSLSSPADSQTLTGGTIGASTSGAITVNQVRQLIATVQGVSNADKAVIMRPGTYVAYLAAIEALSWSLRTDEAGVQYIDGVTPVYMNGFMPKTDHAGGGSQTTCSVYCAAMNPDIGFAGLFASGGQPLEADLNPWGGAIRYDLVRDADSTQMNLQLWAHINFVLQETTAFAQIVGITNQ